MDSINRIIENGQEKEPVYKKKSAFFRKSW